MTQTLKDYAINVKHVPLLCDNESAIKIAHNPVQHSQTKVIEVCHHFIRDHVAKGDMILSMFVPISNWWIYSPNLLMRKYFAI